MNMIIVMASFIIHAVKMIGCFEEKYGVWYSKLLLIAWFIDVITHSSAHPPIKLKLMSASHKYHCNIPIFYTQKNPQIQLLNQNKKLILHPIF